MIWVSPTEPAPLRQLGDRVSMFPEEFGVDVLVAGQGDMVGVQRKTIADFCASVQDGRLAEQVVKMGRLDMAVVLLEGKPWFVNGALVQDGWGREISQEAWRRMIWTVRAAGIHVEEVDSLEETCTYVGQLHRWCESDGHSTLAVKGKRVQGAWGERGVRHYRMQMLCGLPGMGEELAGRVLEQVGWPFELVVDLTQVRGLGKKKVGEIERIAGKGEA